MINNKTNVYRMKLTNAQYNEVRNIIIEVYREMQMDKNNELHEPIINEDKSRIIGYIYRNNQKYICTDFDILVIHNNEFIDFKIRKRRIIENLRIELLLSSILEIFGIIILTFFRINWILTSTGLFFTIWPVFFITNVLITRFDSLKTMTKIIELINNRIK